MVLFLPLLILIGLFGLIGIYWAVRAEHFLEWTTMSNLIFRKVIYRNSGNPYLVRKSYAIPSRMETDSKLSTFVWSLRFLGMILILSAVFTYSFVLGIVI